MSGRDLFSTKKVRILTGHIVDSPIYVTESIQLYLQLFVVCPEHLIEFLEATVKCKDIITLKRYPVSVVLDPDIAI